MDTVQLPAKPKILIIRLSAIGDVIHTLPALHALRERLPEAQIGWIVEEFAAPLLKSLHGLNKIHCLSRKSGKTFDTGLQSMGWWQLLKSVRKEGYDVSIDFQGLTKSAIWGWLSGAKHRIGYGDQDGRELSKLFYNHRVIPAVNARHVIDRNLSLLSALDIVHPEVRFTLPVHEQSSVWAENLQRENTIVRPFLVVHPGAGWQTKRWAPDNYAQLCRMIHEEFGHSVVLSTGPKEEKIEEVFRQHLKNIPFAAPRMNQLQLQEMARQADVFIGPDTGPMHLAVAVGTRTVAIFGASDAARNGPYGYKHLVIIKDTECQPCWKTECPTCSCLNELTVEEVHRSVREHLLNPPQAAS